MKNQTLYIDRFSSESSLVVTNELQFLREKQRNSGRQRENRRISGRQRENQREGQREISRREEERGRAAQSSIPNVAPHAWAQGRDGQTDRVGEGERDRATFTSTRCAVHSLQADH